ncbi:MAG TPA: UDP-2,3-diacylglucosamine diphosphatase [Gallionellaceae bacterium]
MAHTLFISDLHLCEEQAHTAQLFLNFLRDTAPQAEALYILGDLFEYWAGDDDLDTPFHCSITDALHALGRQGTRIYLMHGNRDLLMGDALAQACHATLLPDPTLIDLYGTSTLLSHGDILCTDDLKYQAFRRQVRDPQWRAAFLAQPLAKRKAQIEEIRTISKSEKSIKSMDIMDVNGDAVADLLRAHRYPRLIHGHTHRRALHQHAVDGHLCERWVLGDWHQTGNALLCEAHGCRSIDLA